MFDNIIGNEEVKKILNETILKGNISHSYIFSGVSGIGKFLFAKEFAKAILCSDEHVKPCNNCKSCNSFKDFNNPDITIIDEQEHTIKTEQIKNLVSNVLEKPIQGEKKVYIINNSENMTIEAQNSLLKTLEEPPEYIVIILITSNENLLLNTIKSRCIKISFNSLTNNEIKQYFNRISETADEEMFNAFGGSIENALKLKNQEAIYAKINNCFKNVENKNELQILKLKEEIFQDKEEIYSILDYINTIFYNKILENVENTNIYLKFIETVEKTKIRLKSNSNYDMSIDYLLLTIWEEFEKNG